MSLFGGVDLGSPAQRSERTIRAELELRRNRWRSAGRIGYVYDGGADLLLQHGRFYPGRRVPDAYVDDMGVGTHCFENAIHACQAHPELVYCEGVYFTGHSYPTSHGFCVAPDGGVVELTYPTDPEVLASGRDAMTGLPPLAPEHWGYWGAIFAVEFVIEHGNVLGVPMLDRSPQEVAGGTGRGLDMSETHDWPTLKLPYDPQRKSLP